MEYGKDNTKIKNGKKRNEWLVTINGIEHSIYFGFNKNAREYRLWVDNEEVQLPKTFITKYLWIDQSVEIDGIIIHCVYDGETFDIALHGKYANSKKNYYPLKTSLYNIIVGIPAVVIVFLLIGFNAPNVVVISTFISILCIWFFVALYSDYIKKKAGEE